MKQNATIQRQEDHSIGNEAQTQESSLSPNAAFRFPKRGFSLFHLNTRSLFPKIDEIRLFAKNSPFNVPAFSETWLSESVSNSEISIQGYSDHDCQYEEYGGGSVAVYLNPQFYTKKYAQLTALNSRLLL